MSLFRKKKFEQELDDELRSYVELKAAEKIRCGMSPEDALREARRELGGMDQVKEENPNMIAIRRWTMVFLALGCAAAPFARAQHSVSNSKPLRPLRIDDLHRLE